MTRLVLKNIKKKNLYEEIISEIIQYIQEENLKPGDKLPTENEFVEIFQVSKTAIREALSVLVAKGIIEKRSGVGSILKGINGSTFIEPITQKLMMEEQTLKEILEFRRGVEVESAALAAQRATIEQLEAIENAHLELIEVNHNGGIGIEEDYRFHSLIIISSGNSIYETIFDIISPTFLEALKVSKNQSKRLSKSYLEEAHHEHGRILNALKKRDVVEARLAMLDHLEKNEMKIWNNAR
ncbi:FadR/GntR family transcriptional regulator [Peribacillus frigoritolerans]|uniref:FadR/GntR family transcriptional regulator n=1 Tax=Peribacillus frigoritolerans TaxID=450367 RepID=UPI0039A228E6